MLGAAASDSPRPKSPSATWPRCTWPITRCSAQLHAGRLPGRAGAGDPAPRSRTSWSSRTPISRSTTCPASPRTVNAGLMPEATGFESEGRRAGLEAPGARRQAAGAGAGQGRGHGPRLGAGRRLPGRRRRQGRRPGRRVKPLDGDLAGVKPDREILGYEEVGGDTGRPDQGRHHRGRRPRRRRRRQDGADRGARRRRSAPRSAPAGR